MKLAVAWPSLMKKQRRSNTYVLIVTCFAVFTDVFLYGVVSQRASTRLSGAWLIWCQIVPVIPFSLTERVRIQGDTQRWVSILFTVFGAALFVASPICGWLVDQLPSRRVAFLTGLSALTGSMALLCAAHSIPVLILGRVLQGFATASVWVVGCVFLVDTVGSTNIGRAMGYVTTASSVALLVGPLVGGIVYATAGYYAVFGIAFGLLGLDIILRLLLIDQQSIGTSDLPSVVATGKKCETGQVVEPSHNVKGIQQRPRQNFPEDLEQRRGITQLSRRPSVPSIFRLLASHRLLAALWAVFVEATFFTSFDTVLPLYTHQIFHWNSIGGGLAFLPLLIPAFAGPLMGMICDRFGARWPTVAGFLLTLPCFVLLRFVTHDTLEQKVLLCALLALAGVALTLAFTPLMTEIAHVVNEQEGLNPGVYGRRGGHAQAYALFNMAWAAGTLVGPIWSGYVKQSAGWDTMAWSLGTLGAVTAVPTALWMSSSNTTKSDGTLQLALRSTQDDT